VGTSIDDFGTGYSSLAYLKHLPLDELKVDRSFVSSMARDDNDLTIVRSTVDLSHNLGLEVVAEGVEDAETLRALAGLGCDRAQGYLVSPPLPADAVAGWVAGRQVGSVLRMPQAGIAETGSAARHRLGPRRGSTRSSAQSRQ
jgi:EAL domain-containing protein (putative c-di-GMP-specific phosphodiesterase class I)